MLKWVVSALLVLNFTQEVWAKGFPVISGMDTARGTRVKIDPLKQKVATAVIFLSVNCPCSRSHEPVLTELSKKFPEITFVGVNSNMNEKIDYVRDHFEQVKLPFPVVRDNGTALADAFGALKTPHVFLLSPSGEMLFEGGVDSTRIASKNAEHYLENAMEALRKGQKPNPARVRSLGCVIRRSSS